MFYRPQPVFLSVCIITKNEAAFIETCLQSVQNIADEIIIADSGSTDQTLALAAAFHPIIIPITWRNDYAWARNQAVEAAKGNWILFLDADEYLEGAAQLKKQLQKTRDTSTGGYLIERLDVYRHRDSGKIERYPVGLVRLFRNHPAFRYTGSVHEQCNTSITEAGYQILPIRDTRLIHQVFRSADDFLLFKQERYLTLINKELEANPVNYWMRYQQAKTAWFLEQKERAILLFAQLSTDSSCPLVICCSAFCNLAILYSETGAFEAAIGAVKQSLAINPRQSLGYVVLGDIYYRQDRFPQAIHAFQQVKTSINVLRYNEIIPGDLYLYPEEKWYKIGCCYLAMNRLHFAAFLFKKGLRKAPRHTNCLYGLALVQLKKGNRQAATQLLQQCMALDPGWVQVQRLLETVQSA
jgi:glycosyltransferase involved in cell wall biosynthesis